MSKSNSRLIMPLGLFIFLLLLFPSCNNTQSKVSIPELTIGIQNSPSNSLVIIAKEKEFFDTTKIKVGIKEFSAGKLALQALLGQANDIDIAVSAETPIVLSTLGGNKIKVISEVVKAKNECRVVVRKDANLSTPEKYFSKKRKLTTSMGGSPEWLTYNFINRYNIDKSNLEILAMLPENMPTALSNGAVDAVSIFDPYARIAESQLGDQGMTFLNTDATSYYILSVKESVYDSKQENLKELIKGLLKAEQFIKENPEQAKQIIARKTKLDIGIINSTWSNYSFAMRFDNELVELCKAQSSWAIETGKYPMGTPIPDFRKIMGADILREVAPKNVILQ